MRVRVFRREGNNQYYFQFLRDDGQVILNSEGYTTENARDNGVQSVINNSGDADKYETRTNDTGGHFFILKAANGQEIGRSVTFRNPESRNSAITLLQGEGSAVQGGGTNTQEAGKKVEEGTQLEAANRDANISIGAPPPPKQEDGKPKKKRKKRTTPKKPKAEKVYVAKGNYHFNDLTWDVFMSGNQRYYFTFKNKEGKTLFLNSDVRGFETQEQAEAVIEQILLYAPYESNYEGKVARNGKYYFYIKGEEGKNIGKSFFYGSSEDMQSSVGLLLGNELQMAAIEEARKAATNIDEYLACSAYSGGDGFYRFKHDDNGEFYFSYNNDGNTYLRSEGYTTEKARDNGIESVIKNAPLDERWKTVKDEEDGMWYYSLRAGNHQEIARSCGYESEEDMTTAWGWIRGEESTIGKGAQFVDGVWYSGGWIRRKRAEEEAAAAALVAKKKAEEEAVALAARKKEEEAAAALAASKKNIDEYLKCSAYQGTEDGFHQFKNDENGEFYFSYIGDGKVLLRSEGYTTEKARDNGIESVIKNAPLDERWKTKQDEDDGMWYYSLRAGNNQEIARSCGYDSEAAMDSSWQWVRGDNSTLGKGAQFVGGVWYSGGWIRRKREEEEAAAAVLVAKKKAAEEAEAAAALALAAKKKAAEEAEAAAALALAASKKNIDEYLECSAYQGSEDGFHRFKNEENGEFYFSYIGDGKILLRSEGYTTEKARDNGIESVIKNAPLDERWKTKQDEDDGMWYYSLRAGNNQEIARSCGYDSEAAMTSSWGWIRGGKSTLGKGAALIGGVWYSGWWVTKKKEEEEAEVLRLATIDRKAKEKKEAAAAAAAAAALALAAKKKEEEEAAALALVAAKREEEKAAVAAAALAVAAQKKEKVAAAAVVTKEGSGTMGWWPWLLLIPLLLAALWFSRGCYGCGEQPVIPQPMSIVVPPVIPPTPPAPVCACDGNSDNTIFNVPSGRRAQTLTRLGTNPEFGNSHGLSGPKFLGKLRNRYATESVDKKFLDNLFTAMGYANGFADATADMFTEVTLANGKTGNMGYGRQHGTTYTTLNAKNVKDLEAFRIQASNGCDVHFMKTCGNHFFFCD